MTVKSLFPIGLRTPKDRLAAKKAGKYVPSLNPFKHLKYLKFGASILGRSEHEGVYIPLSQVKGYWTSDSADKHGNSLREAEDFFGGHIYRDSLNTNGYYLDEFMHAVQAFGIAQLGPNLFMPCLPDPHGNSGMTVFPREYFRKGEDDLRKYVESARHKAEKHAEQCLEADREYTRLQELGDAKAELSENFLEAHAWCRHHRRLPHGLREAEYPANLLQQKLGALKRSRGALRLQIKRLEGSVTTTYTHDPVVRGFTIGRGE